MRYSIHVDHNCESADSLSEAIRIMGSLMYVDKASVRSQVEESGVGRATYGFTSGQIIDLEWLDPAEEKAMEAARNKVRELYGEDGVLEVDEGADVTTGDDGHVVEVWVWVSDSDAGISEEEEPTDDLGDRYVAAAEHPVAEFDDDSEASMGCDSGAYVSGWICIGIDEEDAEAA